MDPAWEWHVGDPIGFGNDVGAPEVPYMSYGPKSHEDDEEEEDHDGELRLRAVILSGEAWKLYNENRFREALVFVNRALEYSSSMSDTWNRKAVILTDLKEYEEALTCYDEAIAMNSSEVYAHNKAICLSEYGYHLRYNGNFNQALCEVEKALEIFQDIGDKSGEDEAWNLKGIILEEYRDVSEAFSCYKKAMELAVEGSKKEIYKQNRDRMLQFIDERDLICPDCGNHLKVTDNFCLRCGKRIDEPAGLTGEKTVISGEDNLGGMVLQIDDESLDHDWTAEKLSEIGRENLITITGTYYYDMDERLVTGAELRLVRERDNAYDSDAVAVYLGNDKIGYVANSPSTACSLTSKASDLNIQSVGNAEYLVRYLGEYHIARIDEL